MRAVAVLTVAVLTVAVVTEVGQRFDACRRVVLHSVVCETDARVDGGGYLSDLQPDGESAARA